MNFWDEEQYISTYQRQYNLASAKYHKAKQSQKANTVRNIRQKEKQIIDQRTSSYRKQERIQKLNNTDPRIPRTFNCTNCNKTQTEPCRCRYIQWCGKDCNWEQCYESTRLGICNYLAVSYDVLCDYHSSKYLEYLE
jgi:hypothetical protein